LKCEPPEGGSSPPELRSIQLLVFLFPVLDIFVDHGFVSTDAAFGLAFRLSPFDEAAQACLGCVSLPARAKPLRKAGFRPAVNYNNNTTTLFRIENI
jgi:hypothetical protein